MDKSIHEALTTQLNLELSSSYLYLSMAAWLETKSLKGLAHWVRVQAKEEQGHADKIFDHLLARGQRVALRAIEAPASEWASPLALFQAVLEHERRVSASIHRILEQAQGAKDHATVAFFQWFASEQVEEEAVATELVAKLEMIGPAAGGLLVLDHHLGKR